MVEETSSLGYWIFYDFGRRKLFMVNYRNVVNQSSSSIKIILLEKSEKIAAFRNCVWFNWNCFMELGFVVSFWILGFMERNP